LYLKLAVYANFMVSSQEDYSLGTFLN